MPDTGYDLNALKKRMDGAIAAFKHELSGLRTGRASANLLDPIMVQAYGQSMPITQVGTITCRSRAWFRFRSGTSPWSARSSARSANAGLASIR